MTENNNIEAEASAPVSEEMPAENGEEKEQKPEKKKRSSKKLWISLGVIVGFAVIGAAVVGGLAWHEKPSFCGQVCHAPMGAYVENYYEGSTLARIHAEANVTCLDCHEPSISEQTTELWKYVTGNYDKKIVLKNYDNGACLKCHISTEFQAAKTDLLEKNPHADGHQEMQCTDCHNSHDDQTDYCAGCHNNGGQRIISYPLSGHTETKK